MGSVTLENRKVLFYGNGCLGLRSEMCVRVVSEKMICGNGLGYWE